MVNLFDLHTHTVVSSHAYSTVKENAEIACKKGLKYMGMSDHGPAMPESTHEFYYGNIGAIPSEIYGVKILKGAELNIIDTNGNVDLPEELLKRLDYTIASKHVPCFEPSTKENHTKAILSVMENKYVNIIGHLGDLRYPYDIFEVVKKAKETNTIIELNATSLSGKSIRKVDSIETETLVNECIKYGVYFAINSDAHYCDSVGDVQSCFDLVEKLNIPNNLILNYDIEKFFELVALKRKQ